ncbi:MAG: UDP-N-acetylmuramate--L-alanine ligase, partial [Acidobacteria bacterium]
MFDTFAGLEHVHFVGIGGAGMSGIAEVLQGYELTVSGCDLARGESVTRLEDLGIRVCRGHDPAHLEGVDLVVKSSAVAADNEEIVAARQRGITVVRRAEMLAELMRLKYGIAVAGTHGKTTTTSLIGSLLTDSGLDPTVIVGGRMRVSGTGARIGASHYLVAEADEFDRSFLRLMPIIAVITSIDEDHLDTYGDLDAICDAFVDFASRVPFFGQIVLCLDDPNVQRILPQLAAEHRVVTYGFSPQADLAAVELEPTPAGWRFGVVNARHGKLATVSLPMLGKH